MLSFFSLQLFVAFPSRKDAILQDSIAQKKKINVYSSGSLGLHYHGNCHQTYPNETLSVNEKLDWCSNVAPSQKETPWISFNIENSFMKLTGYSIRNGCCYYLCCCVDDNTDLDVCCCELYSYSLQGSNDNITWKTIHKIEKQKYFYYCLYKTYEFPITEPFKYIRFVQDENYPGCPFCMQINQIEFYGEVLKGDYSYFGENEDEEAVSIIGKINNRPSIE